ncbi:MAG: hypothetical protein RL211_2272 [Pseudomonadota bacterium]|jgi:hypothetical protein
MKLGTWLAALVQPLFAKLLLALGFSVVTITGVDVAVNALRNNLASSVGSLPADLLQLFALGGGNLALGIIMGAVATRLALWQIQSATKVLGVAS